MFGITPLYPRFGVSCTRQSQCSSENAEERVFSWSDTSATMGKVPCSGLDVSVYRLLEKEIRNVLDIRPAQNPGIVEMQGHIL